MISGAAPPRSDSFEDSKGKTTAWLASAMVPRGGWANLETGARQSYDTTLADHIRFAGHTGFAGAWPLRIAAAEDLRSERPVDRTHEPQCLAVEFRNRSLR